MDKYTEPVFGHHFVFKYAPGGAGALGTTEIAQAKPDGYTIGTFNFPQIVAQPLAGSGQYTPASFDYIAQLVSDPQIFATLKSSPYGSMKDLIAAAKAKPGSITVGYPGAFDATQLDLLQLQQSLGVKFTPIGFDGGAPEEAALLGGHIDAAMINESLLGAFGDKLHILAVSTEKADPALPGVPTFSELGYKLVSHDGRLIIAPKGLPASVLQKLRSGFKQINDNLQFQADMKKANQAPGYLTGEQADKFVKAYEPEAKQVLKDAGLSK